MKKTLYILLSIAAVLGCTKTGVEYDDAQIGEITVSPVAGGLTKAAVTDGVFPSDNHLGVFAYYSSTVNAGVVSDYSTFSTDYLANAEFTHKEGFTWSGINPYYWPKTGSLVFAGYSLAAPTGSNTNSNANGIVTYSLESDCLEIKGFAQSEKTDKTYDLLYFGRTSSSYSNNSSNVSVALSHAMSWVEIQVKAGPGALVSGQEWIVTSMEFQDICTKGDFKYARASDGQVAKAMWDNQTDGKNMLVYTHDKASGTNLTDAFQTLENIKRGTLVIPQIPKVLNVKVEYKSPAGDDIVEVVPIKLWQFTDKWEAGKKYTYQLTFSPQEILVAPKVETWPDPTNTTPTI